MHKLSGRMHQFFYFLEKLGINSCCYCFFFRDFTEGQIGQKMSELLRKIWQNLVPILRCFLFPYQVSYVQLNFLLKSVLASSTIESPWFHVNTSQKKIGLVKIKPIRYSSHSTQSKLAMVCWFLPWYESSLLLSNKIAKTTWELLMHCLYAITEAVTRCYVSDLCVSWAFCSV